MPRRMTSEVSRRSSNTEKSGHPNTRLTTKRERSLTQADTPAKRYGDSATKIASIVLFVLALASLVSLALTANALKSTKAQLVRVQAQLAEEVTHSSELQHALQVERVANNEYMEKTKKADDTRDAFMRVARDLDVVPIDDSVRKSAIDAYKSLICADSVASSR